MKVITIAILAALLALATAMSAAAKDDPTPSSASDGGWSVASYADGALD